MITLAVLFVVDQVVKNWQELTQGRRRAVRRARASTTNTWLWVAALVALFVAHWFRETRAGRFAVATREDEIAAPAIGIDRSGPRWTAWTVSIAVVGLAGALRVQAIGSTNPEQYTLDVGVLLLAMLVVGGMRTVTGAVRRHGARHGRQRDRPPARRPPRDRTRAAASCSSASSLLAVMLLRPGGLLGDTDVAGVAAPPLATTAAPARRRRDAGTDRAGELVADGIDRPLRRLHRARRRRDPRRDPARSSG